SLPAPCIFVKRMEVTRNCGDCGRSSRAPQRGGDGHRWRLVWRNRYFIGPGGAEARPLSGTFELPVGGKGNAVSDFEPRSQNPRRSGSQRGRADTEDEARGNGWGSRWIAISSPCLGSLSVLHRPAGGQPIEPVLRLRMLCASM